MRMSTKNWSRGVLIGLLVVCVGVVSGSTGYVLGRRQTGNGVPGSAVGATSSANFASFWQAWQIINQKFYGQPNAQKQEQGAISGMVAALQDPYTLYLPPTDDTIFRSDLEGSFGGIGAELVVKDGLLTVESTLQGTPAEKAGLKSGDVILAIDGTKTDGLTLDDAVTKIRGAKGTQVVLTVARAGNNDPLKISITRDTVVVPSVTTSSIGTDNQIAYIKVNEFGTTTFTDFQKAVQAAKDSGKKGMVLDLRDNPGGYLDTAADMTGLLIAQNPTGDTPLQKRIVVEERYKDGTKTDHNATTDPILDSIPLVVLVNGGSASASEIMAGALRDYGRAKLVGDKTFGKGSVQELIDLDNKAGSIKVTVAHWFTPEGTGIDGKGLQPDIKVDLQANESSSDHDTQVQQALLQITK